LCLFDPSKHEWSDSDQLILTTIPWTLRWLFHYEHWLAFGDWRGDPIRPAGAASEISPPLREEPAA
jgi:hypothetical protein